MKKVYLLIAYLALLLTAFVYYFGSAGSVLPGWHVTIYPPYYRWLFIALITLLFAGIGYWLFIKKTGWLNWLMFIIYYFITTATYFFLKFPTAFVEYQKNNQQQMVDTVRIIALFIPVATLVLIGTQILLVVYIATKVILRKIRR